MESDQQANDISEMLDAQLNILNQSLKFINSMSLKCAIQLNIPNIIENHGAPMTLSELVKALGIGNTKTNCLYRLMRILIHSGYFAKQKISKNEEGYVCGCIVCISSNLDEG